VLRPIPTLFTISLARVDQFVVAHRGTKEGDRRLYISLLLEIGLSLWII
jgi:hypothetical protein